MSATDELRKLLDERGVEYRWDNGTATWYVDGVMYNAWGYDNERLTMSVCHLTPEQAIVATLGAGTCHVTVQDNMAETDGMGDVWLECDACRWQMPLEPSTPRFNFCPNCGRKVDE